MKRAIYNSINLWCKQGTFSWSLQRIVLPSLVDKYAQFSYQLHPPLSVDHPSWRVDRCPRIYNNSKALFCHQLSFDSTTAKCVPEMNPRNQKSRYLNQNSSQEVPRRNPANSIEIFSPTVYRIAMVIHHRSHPPSKFIYYEFRVAFRTFSQSVDETFFHTTPALSDGGGYAVGMVAPVVSPPAAWRSCVLRRRCSTCVSFIVVLQVAGSWQVCTLQITKKRPIWISNVTLLFNVKLAF